jgi:hypothetical protein
MSGNNVQIKGTYDDQISGPLDKLRDKFDTLGKSKGAQSILGGVGLAAGSMAFNLLENSVGGVTNAVEGMISKASDLNETVNKVDVVFGQSAASVDTWGNTTASAMGLSKQAAEEAAASIGNLLRSTGTAPAQIAPMSMSLVKLAGDLASFNNIDPTQALDKLKSGLVGQERPLRELGVAISAASVDTEALALGFTKVNGTFTEGQKVQARYALIFAQTKTAQGDFARTSDGLANAQRILNAEFDNAQAVIGEKLLPVVDKLVIALSKVVVPGAEAAAAVLDIPGNLAQGFRVIDANLPKFGAVKTAFSEAATEAGKLNVGVNMLPAGIEAVASAANKGEKASAAAAKQLEAAGEAAYYVRVQADRATPKVRDFFDVFNAAVGKGNIAQTTLTLMDDRKAIEAIDKQMDKAKPGTAAYKKLQLELAVAQGQLAQDTMNLRTEQAKLFQLKPDKSNTAALKKWFDSIGLQVNNLQGDAKAAYDALMKLLHINVSAKQTLDNSKPPPGTHPKKNAKGGWVGLSGPELSWVGEEGPEYIVPNNKLGSRGGSGAMGAPIIIPVPSHWSPGEQQKWARDALKALLPEMKRMGLL